MKPLPLSLLVVLAPAAAQAACPVFDVAADQAATAVRGFQFAVADEALAEALTAVGCAEVDDPQRLARLMRIHGARRFFDEDVGAAERYLAAARALDPQTFEAETWGDEALALWQSADAGRWGEGTLAVIVPGGAPIVVDGRPGQNPAKVAAIPHVVRLGAFAARVADVQPEATTVVDLSGVDLTPPVVTPEPVVEAPPSHEAPPIAEPEVASAPETLPISDRAPGTAAVALPIEHIHGRWYMDANGTRLSDDDLERLVGDAADGHRYRYANERLSNHRVGTAVALGFGGAGLLVAGVAAPVYAVNAAKYRAQWDDPTSDCMVFGHCRPKPEDMLVVSVTVGSIGAILTSGGLANVAAMPKLHRKAADAATVTLADPSAGAKPSEQR